MSIDIHSFINMAYTSCGKLTAPYRLGWIYKMKVNCRFAKCWDTDILGPILVPGTAAVRRRR